MEVSESKTTTLSPSGGMGVSQPCLVVLYSINHRLIVKKIKVPILTFVQNDQKSTYTFNSLHFLVEMSISDSKTPRNYIVFHTSYDYRGRILINKDLIY